MTRIICTSVYLYLSVHPVTWILHNYVRNWEFVEDSLTIHPIKCTFSLPFIPLLIGSNYGGIMRVIFWIVFTMALIPFGIGIYKGIAGNYDKAISWIVASMIWAILSAVFGTAVVPTDQYSGEKVVEKTTETPEQ